MQIQNITIASIFNHKVANKQIIRNNNISYIKLRYPAVLSADTVSFSGKSINPLWDDFMKQYNGVYKNKRLEDILNLMISKNENKLGEGQKKKVYSIDGINDYVVAFLKDKKLKTNTAFVAYKDPFPGFNFSQPVGGNNSNIIIMKKIPGTTYGLKDWSSKFTSCALNNEKITLNDAKTFLTQLENVEKLPLDSYIDLAKQVKFLNDKKLKIDMFNPNNILIDMNTNKITYFDLFDVDPSKFYTIKPEINCIQDMVSILTDSLLHAQYLKVLPNEDKLKLNLITRSIANKCDIAGKKVGLCDDKSITYKTFRLVQDSLTKRCGYSPDYVGMYEKYLKAYQKSGEV